MDKQLTATQQAHHSQQDRKHKYAPEPYGRTGKVQVLHIDLWYADGSRGEINVTSPAIAWGHDIEVQWNMMRAYIVKEHECLGIIKYQALCHHIQPDGSITETFRWLPFDLITNQELSDAY